MIQEHGALGVYTLETDEWDVDHGNLEDYDTDPECSFEIWRKVDLTLAERYSIVKCANQKSRAVNYGWLQLISMAIRNLLRRVKVRIKNFIRQGVTCAGVPAYGYFMAQVSGFSAIDPEDIDTQDFYELVQRQGFVKVYEKKRGEKSGKEIVA